MYVEGNPVNLTDPSGNKPKPPYSGESRTPCVIGNPFEKDQASIWEDQDVSDRVDEAEKYVYHTSDPMDTYTAAGIAIQCAGWDGFGGDSGTGAAQISDNQKETSYGVLVGDNRGHGLRCYIPIGARDDGSCSVCKTPEELKKMSDEEKNNFYASHVLENAHDHSNSKNGIAGGDRREKRKQRQP
jgi:hypothetical protein